MEGEKKLKLIRAKANTKESKIRTKERENGQFPPRPLLLDLFHDVIIDLGLFSGRSEGEKKSKSSSAKPNT